MSLDTTQPPLPTNAAQEKGGNLDAIAAAAAPDEPDALRQILLELRILNELIAEGFNLRVKLDEFRNDPDFSKVR